MWAEYRGVCPAATATKLDGKNDGTNGGRACWEVPGTPCEGASPRAVGCKLDRCASCAFFLYVNKARVANESSK